MKYNWRTKILKNLLAFCNCCKFTKLKGKKKPQINTNGNQLIGKKI